jgi:hypothetical protein
MVSPFLAMALLLFQGTPDQGPPRDSPSKLFPDSSAILFPVPTTWLESPSQMPGMGVSPSTGRPDVLGPPAGPGSPSALGLAIRSLAVPGWGQRTADRGYWWLYTGIDALALGGVVHQRREGARHRTAYRDLAWEVARTPVWVGPRRDGPWSYYEQMGKWSASGHFDRRPDLEQLHPETNEETFNGMIWRLARDLHLPADAGALDAGNPAYQQALAYYRNRAVPPDLQWDWQGQEESRSRFRTLIQVSDEAFRGATTFVGVALVNRFISGAEVWISAHPGPLSAIPITLESRFAPGPEVDQWKFKVRLRPRSPPSSWPHS